MQLAQLVHVAVLDIFCVYLNMDGGWKPLPGVNVQDDTDLLFLSGFPVWAKL